MRTRSGVVFALGLAAVIAGGGLAYLALAGDESENGTSVLYAARPIPAGTTGANAVAQGLVKSGVAPPEANPPDALNRVEQLAGRVSAVPIDVGQPLTSETFPPAQTRIGTLRIPPGKIALALEMSHAAGVAGFAGAGDKLDIFAVAKGGSGEEGGAPGVRLILQGVEVLNVNGTLLAPTQGQPGGPGLVFLLAVTPAEGERLVYLANFEQLYFSLVPKDQPPLGATPGSGPADALQLP